MCYEFYNSLVINSKDRSLGDLNKFQINKNLNLTGFDCFAVQSFQFTNNIYPINSYNNTLIIGVVMATGTITIAEGNYNATQLITEIINQLNTLGFTTVFSGSFNNITDKITITSTLLNISSLSGTLAPIIGFTTSFTPALSVTGNNPVNISYTKYINFCSNHLLKYNKPNIKTDNNNNILYTLNNNYYSFGSSIREIPRNLQIMKWSYDETINNFDIYILDDNNNPVPMNNSEWVIVIQFYSDNKY